MKKRFAHRTLLDIEVELYRRGRRLGRYRTRDIDGDAVFIAASDIGVNLHDVIEVDFQISHASMASLRRKGVVVRHAGDGIAVVFVNEDTLFFETLEEMLVGLPAQQIAAATDEALNGQLPEMPSYARLSS
ncbi:MAG: hypothetical protein ACOY5W_10720 [Pseudomonadota bacterium]